MSSPNLQTSHVSTQITSQWVGLLPKIVFWSKKILGLGRNSEKKISKKIRSEIYVGRAMSSPNWQTGHVSTQITSQWVGLSPKIVFLVQKIFLGLGRISEKKISKKNSFRDICCQSNELPKFRNRPCINSNHLTMSWSLA